MQQAFVPTESLEVLSKIVIQSRDQSLEEHGVQLLDRVKRLEEIFPEDAATKKMILKKLNLLSIPIFPENLIFSLQIELRVAKLLGRRYDYEFMLRDGNLGIRSSGVVTDFLPIVLGSPAMRFRCLPSFPIPSWMPLRFNGASNRKGEKIFDKVTRKQSHTAFWVPLADIEEGKLISKGSRYRIHEQRLGVLASTQ